ncbi:MAG TPA: hypothetical protein PKC30_08280 [Saprospiraceae bacterium]|nr:hypothetical protein [Saprospiraceae bacterium]
MRILIDVVNRDIAQIEIELDGFSWFEHGVLMIKVLDHPHLYEIQK